MATFFDPAEGVLRLDHAALTVLAMLAADPTDPALRDHAVAPPLAALRAAGILGPAGMDPSVAPLAAAIGDARRTLDLSADEGGVQRRARIWVSASLAVVAVSATDDPDAYDLMADRPAMLADLVGDLVGLGVPAPSGGAAVRWSLRTSDGVGFTVFDDGGLWLVEDDGPPVPVSNADIRRRVTELAGS